MLVWKALNKESPRIDNVCFNGKTCIVFLTQIVCPRLIPWFKISLPVTAVLEFKETDKESGLFKIDTHEEHWSIEGILKAIPIVSFWYDHVVRTMIGKLLSATGEAVYTATETASLLVLRSKEIEETRRRLEAGEYTVIDNNKEYHQEVLMLKMNNNLTTSSLSTATNTNSCDYTTPSR
ncbi:uncharacterized protein BX663DRAFT_498784 [Cokeromyces recurvatus]|uniref:uncharacterized protein n=1 Tax=Cokeromyces recurvatus TaxID=90255 RepID=UPI00221E83E6|nr:uncharacterized protein BX663DRAFT_498784 [Cokeromyces recurvatus]KAI7906101.1 hypothetical protein BX663DRAFT_498784 [Cokeromyces recurvatus]